MKTASKRSPKNAHRNTAEHLAVASARKTIEQGVSYGAVLEHGGDEFWDLFDYFTRTSSAHLKGDERDQDATEKAAFTVGVAVGRLLGGAR